MSVLSELANNLADCAELAEMASAEGDEEALAEVNAELDALQGALEGLEFRRMFQGDMDSANAFLEIQSGSGVTRNVHGVFMDTVATCTGQLTRTLVFASCKNGRTTNREAVSSSPVMSTVIFRNRVSWQSRLLSVTARSTLTSALGPAAMKFGTARILMWMSI